MSETLVAPKRADRRKTDKATLVRPISSGLAAIVEVAIDPTQWIFVAINGQDRIVVGKTTHCMIRQEENRAQDPGTTPTIATTATPIALGTSVPTVLCHCVLSATTKVCDAYVTRLVG